MLPQFLPVFTVLCLSVFISQHQCYEVWSVYFDDSQPFVNPQEASPTSAHYLKQQIFEYPFSAERYVVQISTYVNERSVENIASMQLRLCLSDPDNNSLRAITGSRFVSSGIEYCCVQVLSSQHYPIGANNSVITWPEDVAFALNRSALLLSIEYKQDYDLLQDNSGFDLYVTEEGATYESGIMAVGLSPDERFVLPPNMQSWHTRGSCSPLCFAEHMSEEEFRVIGAFSLTQHPSLVESSLEIVSPDMRQRIFQFGGESSIDLSQEAIVSSENILQVQCEYRAHNTTILGGLSSSNENCFVWIHYYPKMPLTACLSSYSASTLGALLDVDELTATLQGGGDSMLDVTVGNISISQFVANKDAAQQWDGAKLERSRFSVQRAKQPLQCGWKWNLSFLDTTTINRRR